MSLSFSLVPDLTRRTPSPVIVHLPTKFYLIRLFNKVYCGKLTTFQAVAPGFGGGRGGGGHNCPNPPFSYIYTRMQSRRLINKNTHKLLSISSNACQLQGRQQLTRLPCGMAYPAISRRFQLAPLAAAALTAFLTNWNN